MPERGNREVVKVTFGGQAKIFVYSFVYSCSDNRARRPDFIEVYCGVPGHQKRFSLSLVRHRQ